MKLYHCLNSPKPWLEKKKNKGWPKTSEITAKQALSRRDTRIIIKNKDQARAFSSQDRNISGSCTIILGLHVKASMYSWKPDHDQVLPGELQLTSSSVILILKDPKSSFFTVFISILPSSPSWEPGNLLAWEPQKHASMSNSLLQEATLGHPGWMNAIDTVGPKAIWRLLLSPGASPWAHSHASVKTSWAHGLCLYCTTAAVHSLPKA